MKIQNVKGSIDYLPEEQRVRNYINDKLRETFEEYGYQSIETPILCHYDILSGKYDENNDILKEIYKLQDQGKRNLGLRYDLTVPFAKFIALNKNKIKLPFKRYEIAKVFRDGPVKLGRDREFTQCDADVVGISGQMIEAECLSLYVEAFKKLNIDIIIKYNSRNLMSGLILESGIDQELISPVITIVDKMNKLKPEEFKQELIKVGLNEEQVANLLENFKLKFSEIQEKYLNTTNKELKRGIEEISNLNKYIKTLKIDSTCIFTPTLARGQDYYTGNVFEVYEANGRLSGSIGGGGRYDNMITNFIEDGEMYPAVGISFGLTSIYELLKEEALGKNSNMDLYIIPMDTMPESLALATKLRNYGIRVEIEMLGKKVKKCFEWANKNNIPFVTVIGENEIKNQTISIKNMETGESTEYSFDNIAKIANNLK